MKFNNQFIISNDQTFCIVLKSKTQASLYGLNNRIVSTIASLFNHLSLNNTKENEKELIKSLGKSYVALEHNQLNNTRVNISLILSELSK